MRFRAGRYLFTDHLHSLLFRITVTAMKATLTSKGQITIPVDIRIKFHLKTGDVLEFDESTPFLKATKTISPDAWIQFSEEWTDPWPDLTAEAVLQELRGPVELPAKPQRR